MSRNTPVAKRSPRREVAERPTTDPTRAKLVEAATEIFAERGFHAATVREICLRAGANIAAVNYYFHDKLGLYTEVLRGAVATVPAALRPILERPLPPEQNLRAAIHAMIERLYGRDRPSVPFRLMRHELVQPTPALAQVVDELIRPQYDRLRGTIGALLELPADHETTRLCVHSVMGQALFYPLTGPVIARLWPQLKMTSERLNQIADHIADFSLAGIRSKRGSA
ncbi:MAG TPA: CerR family C-terminal domain-containing protein [Candidatus Eremiobacteraceae bacterium]|jgi:AcrR family transcriptional regulator|nr:CerR family C-terminal domain-containing protein [Candidatus Eremiobacteraceae bacterium]